MISILMHLIILNAVFMYILPVNSATNKTIMEEISAYQPGDIILGGLFPTHLSRRGKCEDLDVEGVALVEAMIYTVNRVNKESLLPWNLTLGYDVRDTCNLVSVALKRTLHFLSEKSYSISDEGMKQCGGNGQRVCDGRLVSVIGAGSNEISVAVNKVLSVFKIPQIGYASTSGILSDKSRFPSFLRTVVPGSDRPKVMSKVITHFGWSYVALLTSNNAHWRSLSIEFKNLAHSQGICVGVEEVVPYNASGKEMETIINSIQSKEKLEIILLFTSPLDTSNIFIRANLANMTGKVWIASEVLPDSTNIMTERARVLQGMIVISNKLESVIEFSKYFENLTPAKIKRNPWLRNLWEKVFGCFFLKDVKSNTKMKNSLKICTGTEKVNGIRHMLSFSHVNQVIDAVMSVCHVIKRICREMIQANITQRRERCLQELTKSKILSQMFTGPFAFDSLSNRTVFLDSNGDAISSYRIQNLQRNKEEVRFRTIGTYSGNTLDIQEEKIQWPNKSTKQPVGICSLPCDMGRYRIYEGSSCCWRCAKCSFGYISRNTIKCTACPNGFTSDEERTFCRKIPHVFFGWGTAGAGAIIAISLICFGLSLSVYGVLLKYKRTPVVSGFGREINFRLLWSISFGVLVPFAYIGYPSDNMCKVQTVLFGTSLAFSMSLMLAKAKQVTCKRRHIMSRWRVLVYSQSQIVFSLFLTIIELLICILWIINEPPRVEIRNLSPRENIVRCSNNTSAWYALSTFHILVISVACTYLSYNSRKRLVNYCEAKYILYAMFAFYSVWVLFIAVFYGTPVGLQDVTMNCLVIIASQMVFLGFIFFPKLFIIFLKPRLNREAVFQALVSAQARTCSTHRIEDDHPNGSNRSHPFSLRDASSRGFPSDMSLESSSYRRFLSKKLLKWPCCSCLPRDSSSADSSNSQDDVNHRLSVSPCPLPLISMEEGSRSQTSEAGCHLREDVDTYCPLDSCRCTCELSLAEDPGYQAEDIVSLSKGRKATVWKKRDGKENKTGKRRFPSDNDTQHDKAEGQCSSKLIVKDGNIEEDIRIKRSSVTNSNGQMCESQL